MKFFKTHDWNESEDTLHFKTKSNLKKVKTKKSSKLNKNIAIDKTCNTTIPLLKNSPLLKNVSSIKKVKNLKVEVSKSAKASLKNVAQQTKGESKKIKKLKKVNQTEDVEVKDSTNVNENEISTAIESNNNSLSEGNLPKSSNSNQYNFREQLRQTLKGGRFRYLNERLYTVKGSEAKKMFDRDSTAFAAYHEGYRQQIEKWPFNPLNRMIKKIRKCPKDFVIADFGCGEARLAQSIKHKCFSIDLVSIRNDVIACDMAKTPLKTSSINVALYCLSLMGTNLNEFLLEANRVLKIGGFLYVAEIASRFDNVKKFLITVEKFGFKVLTKDLGNKYFYFFDFKKETNYNENVMNEIELTLKPCIYKKR